MKFYQSKLAAISGDDYGVVERQARKLHKSIASKSKRRAYIRSSYFGSEKIFIDTFWEHLNQKTRNDRKRRLRYYPCAIDLLVNSRLEPDVKEHPNKNGNLVYRFYAKDISGAEFIVQVNSDSRTKI
jgi:hypothetical protein